MADFSKAIGQIEQAEGGYSTDVNDPGNYYPQGLGAGHTFIGTMRGITPTTYLQAFGHVPTVDEMKAVSKNAAEAIYKQLYWDRFEGDSIKDQELANIMLDSAINQGVGTAIKGLNIAVDKPASSVMTADTLSAANNGIQNLIFEKFKKWRIDTYSKGNPLYSAQWIARVKKYKKPITIGLIALVTIGIGVIVLVYIERKKIKQVASSIDIS